MECYASPRNHVVGLDAASSCALLGDLFSYESAARKSYEHRWRSGDVLICDNHAVLHGRRDYDSRSPRRLRRLCVA
ncbi:MAG: TauD/TfdA family dioxygenase [Polyangiaceae bacterium]